VELCHLSEGLAQETEAAELELLRKPMLHQRLALPKRMVRELNQHRLQNVPGVRVMRFDFHLTDEGWKISEVNADVPGGFIEGSGFTKLMAEHFDADSPSATAEAYVDAVARSAQPEGVIAMVHATAYSDDRQVMEYLARLLHERGRECVQVSPEHLKWKDGHAKIRNKFAQRDVAAIVRFFPADWLANLNNWTSYLGDGATPISNPATALLVQSKAFPLVWDELDTDLRLWRQLLPETMGAQRLEHIADDWVLKPVFGRVGEDVGVPGITSTDDMKRILRSAKHDPQSWIVQRRFRPVPLSTPEGEIYPCIGVYTVNGRAVGAYARISHKPLTDDEAQDVAILLEED
jgi:glutathionylspermidine synthase